MHFKKDYGIQTMFIQCVLICSSVYVVYEAYKSSYETIFYVSLVFTILIVYQSIFNAVQRTSIKLLKYCVTLLSNDNLFLMVINSKGKIIFADKGYEDFFAVQIGMKCNGINALLVKNILSETDKTKFIRALYSGENTTITGSYSNNYENVTINLDIHSVTKRLTIIRACEIKLTNFSNQALFDSREFPVCLVSESNSEIIYNNKKFTILINDYIQSHHRTKDKNIQSHISESFHSLIQEHRQIDNNLLEIHIPNKFTAERQNYATSRSVIFEKIYISNDLYYGLFHEFASLKGNMSIYNLSLPVAIIDESMMMYDYNDRFFCIMDGILQHNDFKGISLEEVFSHNEKRKIKLCFAAIKSDRVVDNQPISITFSYSNTGDTRHFLLYVTNFADDNYLNNVIDQNKFIIYFVDISEQKHLENTLAHTQKMTAIGQLVGGIAHDFNNILTVMIGTCDLLLDSHSSDSELYNDLLLIRNNGCRAGELIHQLLAFSRKQTLRFKPMNLNDITSELSLLFSRIIPEDIDFKLETMGNLWTIEADRGQLDQILLNLIVNASKAVKGRIKPNITLEITNFNVSKQEARNIHAQMVAPLGESPIVSGEYLAIKVIDTGVGIPKDIIQQIFEPFFTTDRGSSVISSEVVEDNAGHEGTGLGLATVYGIVKQMSGHIYVSSVEESGTTFVIFFKRYVGDTNNLIDNDDMEENITDTTQSTILLVEDEGPVRKFSAKALSSKGYKIIEASSAHDAFTKIKEHGSAIDLIITDVVMPKIKGPEMVDEIRTIYPEVKVMFISGYSQEALPPKYCGGDFHFLPKPFTLQQLIKHTNEILLEE